MRSQLLACLVCGSLLAFAVANGSELADAAREGNAASVRTLIESAAGGELDSPGRDGMTPLLWAAQTNDLEIARMLLSAGADANLGNRYGITPLWLAATNRSPALVALLLEHGAEAAAGLPHGETPLMAAARSGDAESIQLLLDAGADPNVAETSLGETALMWAAAEDHADAIRVLVAGGADPSIASRVLDLAPMNWLNIGMVSTVLPVGGWPPLLFAGRENATAAALALIEVGADPDIRDPGRIDRAERGDHERALRSRRCAARGWRRPGRRGQYGDDCAVRRGRDGNARSRLRAGRRCRERTSTTSSTSCAWRSRTAQIPMRGSQSLFSRGIMAFPTVASAPVRRR